jgi:hypothetical protein
MQIKALTKCVQQICKQRSEGAGCIHLPQDKAKCVPWKVGISLQADRLSALEEGFTLHFSRFILQLSIRNTITNIGILITGRLLQGSGYPALWDLQVPQARWIAPGNAPSQGYVADRQDSLATVRYLPKGRKSWIKTIALQDRWFCKKLVTCSSKNKVIHNLQRRPRTRWLGFWGRNRPSSSNLDNDITRKFVIYAITYIVRIGGSSRQSVGHVARIRRQGIRTKDWWENFLCSPLPQNRGRPLRMVLGKQFVRMADGTGSRSR